MSKKLKWLVAMLLLVVISLSLFGCSSNKRVEISQPNLMKNAVVMPNASNVKNANKAIDGNGSQLCRAERAKTRQY